ncbi:MAG: hypothetical protein IAE79_05750 [Anaerolinea sp.]|nr:hypothetical protein [Anaerolinea sp.]
MTKIPPPQTIEYWLDFFAHVADERLSPPQAEEAKLVLSLTRSMPAAYRALKAAKPYLGSATVQNIPFAVPASLPLRLLNAALEQLERNVR